MRRHAGVLAALVAVLTAACGGHSGSAPSHETAGAARQFLQRYVTSDGRVIRHDQGGDIVSEGQAYGMLIAELAGDDGAVRAIWRWTVAHLERPDKLLSFHADGQGHVEDPSSATDADTLAAYALLRYDGDGAAALHRAGRQLAGAVLEHETVQAGGAPIPVAGEWARTSPPVVDPSYWMPGVDAGLAALTGDDRWQRAASATTTLLDEATDHGKTLPPDWAQLVGGRLQPTGSPDGSTPAQYGPDAERLPLWFASGCSDPGRRLAAAWSNVLSQPGRDSAQALGLDGSVRDGTSYPLATLASAAAARAAGDDDRAGRLTRRAAAQAAASPTYYGDAWLALAGGLADGALVDCG